MASRSMYTLYNQYDCNNSVEMNNCNASSSNCTEEFKLNTNLSWLNSFVRSFDTSRVHPFDSSWIDFNNNSFNNIHQLFTFMEFSFFLIRCIQHENDNITKMENSNYKSEINYHKIKEIDYIKLLVVVRDKIDAKMETVNVNDPCYYKELSNRLEDLEIILKNSFFSQISDVDVTAKLHLSPLFIDVILDDCNADLLNLDKNILRIHQEWEKKNKQCQSRSSKNRIGRLSEKMSDSLQKDVIKYLHIIATTLERLLNNYTSTVFNAAHIHLTKEFLLEFHTEIDVRQYQNIVYLKHFYLELEQKTLGLILELKENHLMSNLSGSEFNCQLSPIKSTNLNQQTPVVRKRPSWLASTPSLAFNSHHIYPIASDYDDLLSDGEEPSVLSLDSGILPLSENAESPSLSVETVDLFHLSEEIRESEKYDYEKQVLDEDSDCFGSTSPFSESDHYKSLSAICSSVNIHTTDKSDANVSSDNLVLLDGLKGFENYESIISSFQIPLKQQQDLRNKIINLVDNQEANSKFNCALSVTIFHSRNNPFDDLTVTLTHLEQMFLDFVRTDIQEMSFNHNWNSSLGVQNNNSACSPNFVSTFGPDFLNDRNTNNNADSKEDELSELNTSEDDLVNNLSIYAENDQQLAFTSSDSHSSELIIDKSTCNSSSDLNSDTISDLTNANWQRYDSFMVKRAQEMDGYNEQTHSLIIEDIDLALKLSELHLRTEFEYEQRNESTLIESRKNVVKNDAENEDKKRDYVDHVCDTIEEIGDNLKTDCLSPAIVDISMDDSMSTKTQYSLNSDGMSLSKEDCTHDNETLSFSERISLTLSLSDRLLALTRGRLENMSASFKNNDRNALTKIVSSSISTLYSIRQRLTIIGKILVNLKYSILCSSRNPDSISLIEKLISDSENMCTFSFKLEEWIQKSDLSIENIQDTSYKNELPDNLLVKLDHFDVDSILFMSGQRLHITIAALEQYPCYDRLMKSSLTKIAGMSEPICAKKLQLNLKTPQSKSELTTEIHKLRRITAICALNIVDLHVFIAKIEDNYYQDFNDTGPKLKELLLFWRIVDKECHRLLRCNTLIQHVLVDTKRTYVELVSLTAVLVSIIRTVSLPLPEVTVLNQHLENVHNYKLRLIEWIEEVELCSSVVHNKRITNRRFKFYEDIHNFLEENLHSVTELAKNINLGCHKTVAALTGIFTYCSDLSDTSVTEIDSVLSTDCVIDNRCFNTNNNGHRQIGDGFHDAMVNLEELNYRLNNSLTDKIVKCNVSQLEHLLDQSKELFLIVSDDNNSVELQQNENAGNISTSNETENIDRDELEMHILEKATLNLTEKISTIATFAASNAMLLYVDKAGIVNRTDVDTDQQMSNWTSLSHNDEQLDEGVDEIVDDITAIMTASLFSKLVNVEDSVVLTMSCKLVLADICRQLRDRTLDFLVENIVEEKFICDSGNDLAVYFSEEMGQLLYEDSLNTLSISMEPCAQACVEKIQRKLTQKLLEKTVSYIANFVGSFIDGSLSKSLEVAKEVDTEEHVTEELCDLPLPIATYRLWKKISHECVDPEEILTKITKVLQTDLSSLTSYRCDLRKCANKFGWKKPQRNVSKVDGTHLRITSEKISRLVAQFDGAVEEKERPRVNEGSMTIISSKSVQIKVRDIAKELIEEIVDSVSMRNVATENREEFEMELVGDFEDHVESSTVLVSVIPGTLYSMDCHNAEVLLYENVSSNQQRRCVMERCENMTSQPVLLNHNCVLSEGESMLLSLNLDVAQSEESQINMSIDTCPILSTKNSSSFMSHYSPLLITMDYSRDGTLNCVSKSTEEDLSVSSDYESNDTNYTLEETIDSLTSDVISGQRMLNSSEIVARDKAHTLLDTKYEKRTNSVELSDQSQDTVLNSTTEHNVAMSTSNTHNANENYDNNHRQYADKATNHRSVTNNINESDFEESLSRLWLFVFGIFVVLILSMVFHDHIWQMCRCISGGRLLLPKLVSSGLPF